MTLTSEVEAIMDTLCGLLDRESNAVKGADFVTFKSVQEDKFAMLTRYKSLMETLQRQAPALKGGDQALRERLRLAGERFSAAAERNARVLEAGRNSMQRIVDRIVRSARETVHADRQTYTRKGRAGTTQAPLSIQVDTVL
ncbi:MAG: hypothetical protein H6865_05765 [Rhodospirillales bacterium]|nr:hypothetical protein [Alphaproteobacteria bacterium]MCB9987128.1 hypothetical protein [Rhodospirillales bacterium]